MSNQIDPKEVFVIVPAYNEHAVIRNTLHDLLQSNYRVVVIDDGSVPDMRSLLSDLPIYILVHEVNLGQGAALQTGIEFAVSKNAKYIVTFDADGQHQASDIGKLLLPLQENEADITLGSRFLPGGKHNMSFGRKFLIQVGRRLNYLLTGLLLSDAHNGLRAMNEKAARSIHITENRMAHATELLTQIKRKHLRYKEIPVTIHYTEYSIQKGQSPWASFRIFFDLLLNKIFR